MRVDVQRETEEEIAMKMTEKTSGTLAVTLVFASAGLAYMIATTKLFPVLAFLIAGYEKGRMIYRKG